MKPNRLFALLFLLLLWRAGFAQTDVSFRALVLDSAERTPIEGCTVSFLHQGASGKAVTNSHGLLSFKQKTDTALLLLQHVGYRERRFTLLASKGKNTDTLLLSPADKLLNGVVVKAKVPPVVVRDDTTEFNIDSSLFEPFDAVEDLVRRLPGLKIDASGQMTFHGKPITRILVDGEDLFGGDGTFSLKKIPAGMVAKIQVMDTKTLEQLFNGEPTTGDDKTLNIKLKTGNKTFGSADAGAGTLNQVNGGVNMSRFNEGGRLNLTTQYNSNNKAGLFKTSGGPVSSSAVAGLNYGNKWGPVTFNGSYNYNRSDNGNNYVRERTQLLTADTSFFTRTESRHDGRSAGHRLNLSAKLWIDSSSILDATLTYNRTENNSRSASSQHTLENGALRSQSLALSSASNRAENTGATLYWRKWFNRKGRSLSVNARINAADQSAENLSQSTNTYFKAGMPVSGDTLDRRTLTAGDTKGYNLSLTYAEPISTALRFSLNASVDRSRSVSSRAVYNLDSLTHTAVFDSLFSADVRSWTQTQNLTASLAYKNRKLNASAGLGTVWQQTERSLQQQTIRQDLLRYAPSVNASYMLGKQKFLRANFAANTLQPTIDQLQPVPDNSNPLYVRIGNPALCTAFAQNYSLSYGSNTPASNLSMNVAYAPVSNQIVNAVTYDAFRRATSQFINVSGVYAARGGMNFSTLKQKGNTTTGWELSSGFATGRQVYFQAGGRYGSRSLTLNGLLGFSRQRQGIRAPNYRFSFSASRARNWTPQDLTVLNTTRLTLTPELEGGCTVAGFVFASAAYNLSYNKLNYHSAQRRNDEYALHQGSGQLRFQVLKKWYVQSLLSYQYNTQVPEGAPKAQFNANLSANAQLWKNRGRASLTVTDLFATNTGLFRTVGDNYIEDVQAVNLRNAVQVKLQYAFSKLERNAKTSR